MAKNILLNYLNKLNAVITTPNATRTTPVARFKVLGCALFANTAAILAHKRVKAMHRHRIRTSGIPPITKCDTEPVRAVNVIIKTLVPTAVFNSYPITLVKISNIIIPPPAPINPQIKPIKIPHTID